MSHESNDILSKIIAIVFFSQIILCEIFKFVYSIYVSLACILTCIYAAVPAYFSNVFLRMPGSGYSRLQ